MVGECLNSQRTIWSQRSIQLDDRPGLLSSETQIRTNGNNEVAILNRFLGLQPDDHDGLGGVATRMTSLSDNIAIATGNIEHRNDVDMFAIDVVPNAVLNVVIDVAEVAPNLDVQVQVGLLFPDGVIEFSSSPFDSLLTLGASVSGVEFPGEPSTAFVVVQSANQFAGDIGTYTVRLEQRPATSGRAVAARVFRNQMPAPGSRSERHVSHSRQSQERSVLLRDDERVVAVPEIKMDNAFAPHAISQEAKSPSDVKENRSDQADSRLVDYLMKTEASWLSDDGYSADGLSKGFSKE